MRYTLLLVTSALALASVLCFGLAPATEPKADPEKATTYVIVRHAEKVIDGGRDPGLTPKGERRAERLASMLRSMNLDAVLSTDYARTRDTGAPSAAMAGVEPELYDPRKPGQMLESAAQRFAGGCVLVVGHSNTVPDLVRRLGGEAPESDLADDAYDNVFIVTVLDSGRVITHRLHG